MKEFNRKIDWLRVKDGSPYYWALSGGEEYRRNYGDGLRTYRDYSPAKSLDVYPDFCQELLEIATRVDLCVDLNFSKREMSSYWKTIDKLIKISQTRRVESLGLGGGKTSYHEAVKGLKLRVYEKGKQMRQEDAQNWVRVEFQISRTLIERYVGVADSWNYILDDLLFRYTNLDGSKGVRNKVDGVPLGLEDRYSIIAKEVARKGHVDLLIECIKKELANEEFKKNEKLRDFFLTT